MTASGLAGAPSGIRTTLGALGAHHHLPFSESHLNHSLVPSSSAIPPHCRVTVIPFRLKMDRQTPQRNGAAFCSCEKAAMSVSAVTGSPPTLCDCPAPNSM